MSAPTSNLEQGQLVADDTTRFLARQFTGHILGQPAMGYAPLLATVVSATGTLVEVTVDGFSNSGGTAPSAGTPSFLCYFQRVPTSDPPAAGTKCYIAFPANDAAGYGVVVAFRGWPS